MFESIKGAPVEARVAGIAALLGFVVSIGFNSVETTNGVVTSCSRLDLGSVGFGLLAFGAGIAALLRFSRDRGAAREAIPANAARWALDATTVRVCIALAVFGIVVGIYQMLWGANIIGSCP